MPFTRRKVCIVGQSNEVGNGVLRDRTVGWGCPLADNVGPNGYSRSMWPYLSDMMGKRGTWMDVCNSGVGATSIAYSWCGYIRAWQSGMLIMRGSYVLSGGKTFRASAVSAAVVTSTTVPAAGGPDASGVTWVDLGTSAGSDTVGLCNQSHPRFDPNGFIAAAFAGLSGSTGFDEKWCFISIGQGDRTMSTSRADYAQALRNVVDYMLSRSVKVALGFTCYSAESGAEAFYQSDLLPGYADALASYASNPNVKAGANLRTALGVLAVAPASGAGLQVDQLHMNDAAYLLASEAWRDALVAAGW